MTTEPNTIEVEPGSELDRLLDEAERTPLRLVRGGKSFRLDREERVDDPWAGYDPERALAGMEAAAGTWPDLDPDQMKAFVYRAREEGSRPPDRP